VWAGGDGGGRLYRVAPDSLHAAFVGALLEDPDGRVEDVLVDAQGRLQVVVVGPHRAGVIVHEAAGFCRRSMCWTRPIPCSMDKGGRARVRVPWPVRTAV
jgi:hypothetical protein